MRAGGPPKMEEGREEKREEGREREKERAGGLIFRNLARAEGFQMKENRIPSI